MKAWFLVQINNIENNPLELKRLKLRNLMNNEVLIRLKEIGICEIDIDLIEGHALRFGYPSKKGIIPGHEAIGVVEKVGDGVEEFKKGDIAGISMLYNACGKCDKCLSGEENACSNLIITGEKIDGCFSEYFIGKANFIYKIPNEINEIAILTLCNLPLAYKSLKLSLKNLNDKIAIYGLNIFSFLTIQICKIFNIDYEMIILSEKEKEKLGKIFSEINLREIKEIKENYYDSLILFEVDENYYKLIKSIKFKGKIINSTIKPIFLPPLFEGKEVILTGIPKRNEIMEIQRLKFLKKITFSKKSYKFEKLNEALLHLKLNKELEKIVVTVP
jgi:propanol-preferring alcohol dehydrogenase